MNRGVPVEPMLRFEQEEERLQALKNISCRDAESHLDFIFSALGDASWRVRKEAADIFLGFPRAGEFSSRIVELLRSDDNAGLRNTAVEILISLGRQAVPHLHREVTSSDPDVRKFALDILGEIRDPASIPVLIGALSDPDGNVRAAAAENLGKLGSPEAVSHLLACLEEPDLLFRFTVLEALGHIGAEVPVDRLLPFREEKLLRKALFDCLGHIGAATALPYLIEGLTDTMRNVREAAAVALGRISLHNWQEVRKALSETAGGPIPETLASLLESAHPPVRRAAAKLLGGAGDGRFASRLLPLFLDPDTREVAAEALVGLGEAAICSLTSLWAQSDSRTRAGLAWVLGQTGCGDVEELLLEGLRSGEPELRIAAAQALGRIGSGSSIEALAQCFTDSVLEVREAARFALSSIGPRHSARTLASLRPFFQAESYEERRLAVLTLSTLSGGEVDSALAMAMKDESSQVRQAAIRALDGRADYRHLTPLTLALTDEDAEVRQQAVQLLGEIGEPEVLKALQSALRGEVLKALQSALRDEDLWVRVAAVRALGRLGGREAADSVAVALGDSVGVVTIAALEVLAPLEWNEAQGYLEGALRHPDEEVVNAALHLLTRSGRTDWIPSVKDYLINHPHWDVRITFARTLADLLWPDCVSDLQARLGVETEDLVSQKLRDILTGIPGVRG